MDERWVESELVLNLLDTLLREPAGDHQAAVDAVMDGESLRAVHVHGLVQILNHKVRLHSKVDRATCLHTWLFHLLGGARSDVKPPPVHPSGDAYATSKSVLVAMERAAKKYFVCRKELLRDVKHTGTANVTSAAKLELLRSAPFNCSLLRTNDARVLPASISSEQLAGTPSVCGGGEAAWEEHSVRLLAFAMGTHMRLGEGNASRAGPCAVRLLTGSPDVLSRIAAFVRDRAPRTLSPPPTELYHLRRLVWQLELERFAERSACDGLRLLLDEERRAWQMERALFNVQVLKLSSKLEAERCAAERSVTEAKNTFESMSKQMKGTLSELRSEVCSLQRSRGKAITEVVLEWQERLEDQEAATVRRLREQERELREYQHRMYVERNEAQKYAAELDTSMKQLASSLERLRNTSKNDLLQQVAALQAKVRELGARRHATQRKVCEANLDRVRARVATEELQKHRSRINDFLAGEHLDLADHYHVLEEQLHSAQRQLERATSESAAQKVEIDRLRQIAEPPASYFKQAGRSHAFSAAVDLAILECLCLGVARNKVSALFFVFSRFFRITYSRCLDAQ